MNITKKFLISLSIEVPMPLPKVSMLKLNPSELLWEELSILNSFSSDWLISMLRHMFLQVSHKIAPQKSSFCWNVTTIKIKSAENQMINCWLKYPEPGSNRHGSESTGVWDQRVYQFRHLGISGCKSMCFFWIDKRGCFFLFVRKCECLKNV